MFSTIRTCLRRRMKQHRSRHRSTTSFEISWEARCGRKTRLPSAAQGLGSCLIYPRLHRRLAWMLHWSTSETRRAWELRCHYHYCCWHCRRRRWDRAIALFLCSWRMNRAGIGMGLRDEVSECGRLILMAGQLRSVHGLHGCRRTRLFPLAEELDHGLTSCGSSHDKCIAHTGGCGYSYASNTQVGAVTALRCAMEVRWYNRPAEVRGTGL